MAIRNCLLTITRTVKQEADYYHRLYRHPDTPWAAKAFLWMGLAYALSPIDLIPDFVPLIGHLDDLVIVPALILLALYLVPENVKRACKEGSH